MSPYETQENPNPSLRPAGERTYSAEEMFSVWYRLHAEMRVSNVKHTTVLRDTSRVILAVLLKHSPEDAQQKMSLAHRQWRHLAEFWDRVDNVFHVGASRRAPTEPGASLLIAVATEKASPAEQAFVRDFNRIGSR